MKCPNCDGELAPAKRDSIEVEACPTCKGMWLSRQELETLEDEAFHLGDDEKGTLDFDDAPSARLCPVCAKAMRSFQYRFYDLELEFCEEGHGYWLDADEDKRALTLMKQEQQRLKRTSRAEDEWAAHLRHLRSGPLLEKIKNLFR